MRPLPWIVVAVMTPLLAQPSLQRIDGDLATTAQTFRVTFAQSQAEAEEIVAAIRAIADVKSTNLDSSGRFTVDATQQQLGVADWLLRELDRPAGAQPVIGGSLDRIQERGAEQVARVFYVQAAKDAAEFNDVTSVIRSILEVRRMHGSYSRRAIAVRGSREEVEAIAWLLDEMDRDTSTGVHLYPRETSRNDDANCIRVLHYAHKERSRQDEVALTIRTLTDMRRLFSLPGKQKILVRGSASQVAAAEWIVAQLNQNLPLNERLSSAVIDGPRTIVEREERDAVIQLFYFPASSASEDLKKRAQDIREQLRLRRTHVAQDIGVIAVAGPSAQVAKAAQIARQ